MPCWILDNQPPEFQVYPGFFFVFHLVWFSFCDSVICSLLLSSSFASLSFFTFAAPLKHNFAVFYAVSPQQLAVSPLASPISTPNNFLLEGDDGRRYGRGARGGWRTDANTTCGRTYGQPVRVLGYHLGISPADTVGIVDFFHWILFLALGTTLQPGGFSNTDGGLLLILECRQWTISFF
jgi:hypothetical protein